MPQVFSAGLASRKFPFVSLRYFALTSVVSISCNNSGGICWETPIDPEGTGVSDCRGRWMSVSRAYSLRRDIFILYDLLNRDYSQIVYFVNVQQLNYDIKFRFIDNYPVKIKPPVYQVVNGLSLY
jgi:hypothetical protein